MEEIKPGILIYRKEKEEEVREKLKEILNPVIKEADPGQVMVSNTQTIGDSNICMTILTIRKLFNSYQEFDEFLFKIADEFNSLNESGVFAGHLDHEGFLWSDYHQEPVQKIEKRVNKHVNM